jgi:hypothetical protein
MIQVQIDDRSLQDTLDKLDKYGEHVKQEVGNKIVGSAYNIQGDAFKRAPKRTTFLAQSINVMLRGDKMGAKVSVNADYALPVHEGSRPHVIQAKNKPFLVFQVGGRWIRKREVMHPGQKGQPFLRDAANEEFPKLLTRIKKILGGK